MPFSYEEPPTPGPYHLTRQWEHKDNIWASCLGTEITFLEEPPSSSSLKVVIPRLEKFCLGGRQTCYICALRYLLGLSIRWLSQFHGVVMIGKLLYTFLCWVSILITIISSWQYNLTTRNKLSTVYKLEGRSWWH